MVFDTWGGLLAPQHFRDFSLRYLSRIAASLARGVGAARVPLILFSKGARDLEGLAASGCEALGLDWSEDLGAARRRVGSKVALQGNLDPSALYAGPGAIRAEAQATLAAYGDGPGHVFNLGHGLNPDMKPEHVAVLVDAVAQLSRVHHATI
jgi:uroporphyrinogen decarboxylase